MLDMMGERTLTDLLSERVEGHGGRTFLIFEDKDGELVEFTYAEFQERVTRCAQGLHRIGVAEKDFVVLHLANCPEFLIAWFAMARLGATLVPSNVANTAAELEHMLDVTDSRLIVTEPAYLDTVRAACDAKGSGIEIVVARGESEGLTRFDELLEAAGEPPRPAVGSNDLAELIFTSGTTSKPKAVMLTHAQCVRAGLDAVQTLWIDEGERSLTALPLFHVNAQALSVLSTITVAGTLILLEEFRATKFWNQIRRHEATQTCLVAMQLRTVLAQAPTGDERDHKLRRLFFAINVTDQEKEQFEERFGITLINGYGLSEAMTLLACSPIVGPRRWPSIGLPSAGRRLLLVDDDGNEVAQGEVGEIVVEGSPGRDMFLGYYGDEEATREVLRGNRLYTGDKAYADEAGFLYFFDRKKDMIKRAGENVSASEVEAAIQDHPKVEEVSVVGLVDPIRDQAVAAAVVPVEPGGVTAEEIIEWCRARLSKFKVPTVVLFVDELPKTSVGKIRKNEVREMFPGRP